jgi:hypothetical protein
MPSTTRHVHREGSSPGPPLSRVRRGGWSGGGSCLCPRRIYHRWLLLGFCTSATAPRRREAVSSHDPCREAAPMCSITRSPCHTRFSVENRMHLICVAGSKFHTYDRLMSVISQDTAQKRTEKIY